MAKGKGALHTFRRSCCLWTFSPSLATKWQHFKTKGTNSLSALYNPALTSCIMGGITLLLHSVLIRWQMWCAHTPAARLELSQNLFKLAQLYSTNQRLTAFPSPTPTCVCCLTGVAGMHNGITGPVSIPSFCRNWATHRFYLPCGDIHTCSGITNDIERRRWKNHVRKTIGKWWKMGL